MSIKDLKTGKGLNHFSLMSFLRETDNISILKMAIEKKELYGELIASNKNICNATAQCLLEVNCKKTLHELVKNKSVHHTIKFDALDKLVYLGDNIS